MFKFMVISDLAGDKNLHSELFSYRQQLIIFRRKPTIFSYAFLNLSALYYNCRVFPVENLLSL